MNSVKLQNTTADRNHSTSADNREQPDMDMGEAPVEFS